MGEYLEKLKGKSGKGEGGPSRDLRDYTSATTYLVRLRSFAIPVSTGTGTETLIQMEWIGNNPVRCLF